MDFHRMADKKALEVTDGIVVRENTSVDEKTGLKIAVGVKNGLRQIFCQVLMIV